MQTITTRNLFDTNASKFVTGMLDHNSTSIRNWKNAKYNWTYRLWKTMAANFWRSDTVELVKDKTSYGRLTDAEKRVFRKSISFLNFLDGLQVDNLPHLHEYVGAWEIRDILAIQNFQESIHAESYSKILMTIFESEPFEIESIFDEWRDDEQLKQRNVMVSGIYQQFIDNPSVQNFVRTCMGNYNLESIFFWSGFTFFNLLARNGKMLQTNQMIQYIKKDEQTHVVVFANIINELRKEYPEVFTSEFEEELRDMMKQAVEWEIKWGCSIMNDEIDGINNRIIERYIKWLSNDRLKKIGLEPLYPEVNTHPMAWIEAFNNFNEIMEDFFESAAVTNYQQPTAEQGWDEL